MGIRNTIVGVSLSALVFFTGCPALFNDDRGLETELSDTSAEIERYKNRIKCLEGVSSQISVKIDEYINKAEKAYSSGRAESDLGKRFALYHDAENYLGLAKSHKDILSGLFDTCRF
ncbi:hypothetical protein COV93_02890 [Candidatus Woesearchaeota archaeon CG11_big_fil_rev_8_21_14_0_20_43_8]|nr:MAG: hypothetical protein COV93_02890 [Candidatus Woesearchaeota archaeon CG11_big_fil_rev_8_21_14_0_20_43_8]PIO04788.1 MAG: hypothetical protein COT47_07495 [Candidatus Woesearchaeota archaeon CG08_land_8_20_14_0_20_43_7]